LRIRNLPLRIISEEHGSIDLVRKPEYLVILDGIYGSSALVKNPSTRCGTIISLANKLNPSYEDFTFAGITEFISNKIIYGRKTGLDFGEGGVFAMKYNSNNKNHIFEKIPKFKNENEDNARIMIDCYNSDYAQGITKGMNDFEIFMKEKVVKYLDGENISGAISSASMFIDLLEGKTDAVFNMVAKGVFEPPAMYLLTKLLGGSATDLHGNDLGDRKWEQVGMNLEGALFCSSENLSKRLIEKINIIS
jgi:hypothetical protein